MVGRNKNTASLLLTILPKLDPNEEISDKIRIEECCKKNSM